MWYMIQKNYTSNRVNSIQRKICSLLGNLRVFHPLLEDLDTDLIFKQESTSAHTAKSINIWPRYDFTWLVGNSSEPNQTMQRIIWILSRGRWKKPKPTMQMSHSPLLYQPGFTLDLSRAVLHGCNYWCKRSPNQIWNTYH